MLKRFHVLNDNSMPAEVHSFSREVELIPIHMIKPNPYQPRKSFTAQGLEELAQSIREYGVIQPITVRKTGQDGYELIAGERRLRAGKMAGLTHIPSILVDTYEEDSAIMAMIENLQRENLHFLEEAKGYESLIQDHGFTQEELASKLGKNQSTIANKLRILRLSEEVKEILIKENLTERHARALLKLPDDQLQIKAVRQVVAAKLNVRDTERLIDQYIEKIRDHQRNNIIRSRKNRNSLSGKKDLRIFTNTIHNAIRLMEKYGLSVKYHQVEKEDRIEITISIPKS
jgi:ParB family chromosome partitioning protein